MGVNHYLGTFDSEWDAAAIYGEYSIVSIYQFLLDLFAMQLNLFSLAWAHLILYGEEATKQAQKEGEEAAAAYYQEKKDIAEGKIPAAPPKAEKKPKKLGKKDKEGDDGKPKDKFIRLSSSYPIHLKLRFILNGDIYPAGDFYCRERI